MTDQGMSEAGGNVSNEDADLDRLVQKASTPSLASLFQAGKDAGLLQAGKEYGST